MRFQPHNYQRFAIDYIKEHRFAAVLLDMGLGKTVITLTALNDLLYDSFEVHKALIIAPLRVARDTWPAEIQKWDHLRALTYSVAVGTEQERLAALHTPADIYVINRENVDWLINKSGLAFDFDTLVIDELSSFKNRQAQRFKALMRVRHKLHRIVGLTGTPSSNGLMDLWAEYKVLDAGKRLGRFIGEYRRTYFTPDKSNGHIVYSYKLLPGAEQKIYDRIADITISMRSTDHLHMPELISTRYDVCLTETEKKQYRKMKKELVLSIADGEVTAANAAALSGKLLQMANGAVYDDSGITAEIHTKKLDALEDLIEAANGKPLLVAYWFKHDLQRIETRLNSLKIHYASLDSSKNLTDWNQRRLPVGLIHPASAGHGLNLQAGGNTLVWFGLTWSLELYQQTNARLYRQGQKERSVVIQHIVAKGTIDEQVLAALKNKDTTQTALINAVKAEIEEGKRGKDDDST